MSETNWAMVKRSYEVMHSSVAELASQYNISESVIEMAIEENGWEHKADQSLNIEETVDKLQQFNSFADIDLAPKYIALEVLLVQKCKELLNSIEGLEDTNELKAIANILKDHRPQVIQPDQINGSGGGLSIRILTHQMEGDVTSAIEITQSAGETNGIGGVSRRDNGEDAINVAATLVPQTGVKRISCEV